MAIFINNNYLSHVEMLKVNKYNEREYSKLLNKNIYIHKYKKLKYNKFKIKNILDTKLIIIKK
jgi:hypothetical protein